MIKKALFRFEASRNVGAGHAIRSSVIADSLMERGWDCFIVTSPETLSFIPSLARFKKINPQTLRLSPVEADLLIIDHYGTDIEFESYCRPYVKKIMVIDDLANRQHDCDILLDQTYGRQASDYMPFVPDHCLILTGVEYALLRKEIRNIHQSVPQKKFRVHKALRILVNLGGSPTQNDILKILAMLSFYKFGGGIDVALGFAPEYETVLSNAALNLGLNVAFHRDADIAQLMHKADLCIGAAGSGVWERLYLGLPQIIVSLAENQQTILKNIASLKGIYTLSSHDLIDEGNANHPLKRALSELSTTSFIDLGVARKFNFILETLDE